MKNLTILLFCAFALSSCGKEASPTYESAAVAMPDHYSAEVASSILDAGGNAVDAAIAVAFSLTVTFPEAGNIGGGGFMLVHMDGKSDFIDYREAAPLAAHRDIYLDEDGEVIPNSSLIGHRASGVPGTVAGLWMAHQRYASLPWAELIAPAIKLARSGFVVPDSLAENATEIAVWHAGSVNFSDHFGDLRAGKLFVQEDLARTLERIAERGGDEFYRGETARLIVAEMERGDGLITLQDLDRYHAILREPLRAPWRDFEVLSAPPPSSGGFAVIQLLKMKDLLAHEFEGHDHNSPQYIHLIAEIEKRVFADRAEYLGDPDYVDVPIQKLISDDYLRERVRDIRLDKISQLENVEPGLESMETTHFSIVDYDGNAVSNTYTLNWVFGSGVVVEGAGFLLNDEMDDFSLKPGVPNAYGVVGNAANEIQPGKRMLSSMSPTILLREGHVEMIIGTPGGSTIFTSVFQNIINILDFGMDPTAAAGASRFHHQLLPPDLITYSPGVPLSDDVVRGLTDLGYRAEPHDFRFGDMQTIVKDGTQWRAGSDPRKRGESRVLLREVEQ